MQRRLSLFWIFSLVATGVIGAPALGAEPAKRSELPYLLQDTFVDQQVDRVARQVARRYNLTPAQDQYARQMLSTNCRKFIDNHFDELVPLLNEWIQLRFRKDRTAGDIQVWAKKFAPLYQEATGLVVSENNKFHEILDENQKKTHSQDMKLMQDGFSKTTERITRWQRGKYYPGEWEGAAPPKAPDPTKFDTWDVYVQTFIEAYQLDQTQQKGAWAVLADSKRKAQAYENDHQQQLTEARSTIERLSQAKATQPAKEEELAEWKKRLDELEKPLRGYFEELLGELIKIPTDAQILAGEKALQEDQSNTSTKPESKAKPASSQSN